MAFARNHSRVSVVADDPAYDIRPSHWNAAHALSGADVGGIPYCPTATSEATSANLTYAETSGPRLQVGTTGTSAGIIAGYWGTSGGGAIWPSTVSPTTSNFGVLLFANQTFLAGSTGVYIRPDGSTDKTTWGSTAGLGPSIVAGTATTDVNALSATQTLNAGGVTFTHEKHTITNTASAAGSKLFDYIVGSTSTISGTVAGKLDAVSYSVGGAAGASFGPGLPTSITVVNGIVTAIS